MTNNDGKIQMYEQMYYGSEEEEILMTRCYNTYIEISSLVYKKIGILQNLDRLIAEQAQMLSQDSNNQELRTKLESYHNNKKSEESKLEKVVEFLIKLTRYQNVFISKRMEESMLIITDHAPRTSGMLIVEGDGAYYGIDKYHLPLILKSNDMQELIERARKNVGLLRDHEKIEALIDEFNEVKNMCSFEPEK